MTKAYKVWIFAGEASGDIYGAMMANEIRKQMAGQEITIAGMGGPEMKKAGVDILVDSTELGVIGLFEIGMMIFKFIKIFRYLEQLALSEKPDVVILVDYPGFNIRFAKSMYKKGIPVIWYISPQVWAWRKSNIPKLARYCRKMFLIFPFEQDVYKSTGLDTVYVGHPLIEIVKGRADASIKRDDNLLLLLPGSRTGEVTRLFEPMLETITILKKRKPELKFVLSAPNQKIFNIVNDIYHDFKASHNDVPDVEITTGMTAHWQQAASTGIAASGTVTVECAIAGLPLVVVYKLNPVTFFLARWIVIRNLFRGFFTMVNIIADKCIFEEYLQHQVVPDALADAVEKILPGGTRRREVEDGINNVVEALTVDSAGASRRAAVECINFITGVKSDRQLQE